MKIFNKELELCTPEKVDEYGYVDGSEVYAYSDDDLLITSSIGADIDGDKTYSVVVTHRNSRIEVTADRHESLEEAEFELLVDITVQIAALNEMKELLTEMKELLTE